MLDKSVILLNLIVHVLSLAKMQQTCRLSILQFSPIMVIYCKIIEIEEASDLRIIFLPYFLMSCGATRNSSAALSPDELLMASSATFNLKMDLKIEKNSQIRNDSKCNGHTYLVLTSSSSRLFVHLCKARW